MYQTISHYRIIEPLGSGGEGHVWKAEDLRLKRTVAIKFLGSDVAQEGDARERLQREAQMAAALTHPNVATVFEVIDAGEQLCIVMECVEGETVRERVALGPLDVSASLGVAIQVSDALKAAHACGLIHCDIKSSNIMITPGGLVKVLDFGFAKIAASTEQPSLDALRVRYRRDEQETPIEREGQNASTVICGTLGYMSPEQIRGQALDQRTDIFSLGVVLFEMLTGRKPFNDDGTRGVFQSVLDEEPPSLGVFCSDAPLELERIVRRALAKKRNDRYASADDLVGDLLAFKRLIENKQGFESRFVADAAPGSAEPPGISERIRFANLRATAWRHRRSLALVGALAAALAVWDIVSFPPQGAEWLRPGGLLGLAAVCVLSYVASRNRAFGTFNTIPIGAAFRGLLPFQEADRDRFYGRESDAAALFEMVRHSDFRFGVLFGESGCGKTSLLRAGLVPKLWEEGYVPIYCRSYKDPLAAALEECRKRSLLNANENEQPVRYLKRVSQQLTATLVILCDQFEEFFISHISVEEREPFISFIEACNSDGDLPVKFLASMRSDFLYLISSELGGRIAEPLIGSRLFHLRNFDEEQARKIIEKSSRRAGLPFEEGLSRQVARDLASGDVVSPSEMQIVGEQLQSKRIYTLQGYRRAGGKEPLVHGFLEDVIQASGDAEAARLLLRSVISDENTRLTLSVDEIAKRIQRSNALTERLLDTFVAARLIREIQEDEPWRYELMHEYLIDRINQVTGKVMDATQRANRLLRQYASNYSVDRKARIPINRLWFIRRYSDIARGERERELIRKSFRWGLVKAAVVAFLLVTGAITAAAALSVNEEWEGVRMSDGHTAAARKAAFSPDGRLLVTCGEDGRIIVWDFARRERLATFNNNGGWVNSVAFSPDGRWFATPANNTVTVWDARRLERAVVLDGHRSMVNAVVFSADGRLLASISGVAEGKTLVWDTAGWEKAYELPRNMIWGDLVVSPDGRHILIGRELWDLQTANMTGEIDSDSSFVAFAPEGRRLVGIGSAGIVSFFDAERLWEKSQVRVLASQRVHSYHGRAVAFSPDGKLAASGAEDIVLWDAVSQAKLARLKYSAQVWSLAFSPDGKWLVSTHDDGSVVLWDIAEREQKASFSGHSASVHSVAFSPDGRRVASASEDQTVIIWDAQNNQKEAVLTGNTNRVTAVAFSPDGALLASSDMDSKLVIWDVKDHKRKTTTTYRYGGKEWRASYCLAFSPDGQYLAATHGVYELESGRQLIDFEELAITCQIPWNQIYGIGFSPDGRRMVCATDQGYLLLWDVGNWHLLGHAQLSTIPLISLSFAPDGKRLVTGDDAGAVRLWNVYPLDESGLLGRHGARVKSVAFSPDGRQVASSGDDQTISLWDVSSRRLVSRIGTPTSPVLSVAFSPDGKRLACGEQDRSVRIFTRHRSLWGFRLD